MSSESLEKLKNIQEFLHSHGFNQHIISESWDGKKILKKSAYFLGGLSSFKCHGM